ncbi:hypothetical protein [Endozoicomonas arenosclerae]|uniref:hypothetical protein n=1 Tax=Endozoicomonas arenosclerae TaxID=1633495 RepID=UPI0012946659|nr:hypothetical protein [Endozoicomonas arenosclerae]
MPDGMGQLLEQMLPELGGYPLYWLYKYLSHPHSDFSAPDPFSPPPDGTTPAIETNPPSQSVMMPKCVLLIKPGHTLNKLMQMEEEPCEYRLLPGVHWVYKTLPFQEGDVLTSASAPSATITGSNQNPDEEKPDAEPDPEDGNSDTSIFHATPVLRLDLRNRRTGEYYRLRNIQSNETLSTDPQWQSVAVPEDSTPARQPASFRITPVLRLNLNSQSSFSYYRLRVQDWRSIIPPEELDKVPVLKAAESFQGDVLIDFANYSELHNLLIDLELMPLSDDYPLCQRLFRSQGLTIRLQKLLFRGDHICDQPFPDEDPFQDFLAFNLTGNIRKVPESKDENSGKPPEEQPVESRDDQERSPNPPPPPGDNAPDKKHSDDPTPPDDPPQIEPSIETALTDIEVDLAGSLFSFLLSSSSIHQHLQIILNWLDHHHLGNHSTFASRLKSLINSRSQKFPTQGRLSAIEAFAFKKKEKEYKRRMQSGSALRNLLEAAIEGINHEQTLELMAYLNHDLPGITWLMDNGLALEESHLARLPAYKPLPLPKAASADTHRRRLSFRPASWARLSSKRRSRHPPHPGVVGQSQVQLSSEANALVDHLLSWVHSMDDYEMVLSWLDENLPATALQCLQQLQTLMNLKASSANSLTGFWTNAPTGSKASFYASKSRTQSLEVFVSLLTTEEVGSMLTFSQHKHDEKKEDVVKEKPSPKPVQTTEEDPDTSTAPSTTGAAVNAFAAFYASSIPSDKAAKKPATEKDKQKHEDKDKKPAPYVNLTILTPEPTVPALTDTQKSQLLRLMRVIKNFPSYKLSLIYPVASRWSRNIAQKNSGGDDAVKKADKKTEKLLVTAFQLYPPFKNLPDTPTYNELNIVFGTIRPTDIEISLTDPLALALAHFISHENPEVVDGMMSEVAPEPKLPETSDTPPVETTDKEEEPETETHAEVPVLESTPRLLTVDDPPPMPESQTTPPLLAEPSQTNPLRERLRRMTWDISHLQRVLRHLKSETAKQVILDYLKQLVSGSTLLGIRIIHGHVLVCDNSRQQGELTRALQETEHQEHIIQLILENTDTDVQRNLYARLMPKPPKSMTASQTFSPSQEGFGEDLSGYESQVSMFSQSSMSIVSASYQHGQMVQATLRRILQRLASQSSSPQFMAQQLTNLIQTLVDLGQYDAGEILITHLQHELQMPTLTLANYKLLLDQSQLSQQQLSTLQRMRGLQPMATARGNEYQGSISNSPIQQHLQAVLSSIQTQNLNSFEQYFLRLYGQSWNTRGASLPPQPSHSLERGRMPDFSGYTDDDEPLPERTMTLRRDHRIRRDVNTLPDHHQSMMGIHQPPSRRNYRHRTPNPRDFQSSHQSLTQPASTPAARPVSRAAVMKKLQPGKQLTLKLEQFDQRQSAANRGMIRITAVDFQTRLNNMLWIQHEAAKDKASQTRAQVGKALSWFKNHNIKEHRERLARVLRQFFTTIESVEEFIYQLRQAQHQSFRSQTQAHDFIEFRYIPSQPVSTEALLNWVLEQYFTPVLATSAGGVSAAMALTIEVMLSPEQLSDLAQQLERLVRTSRSVFSPDMTSPSSSELATNAPEPRIQSLAQAVSSRIHDRRSTQKLLDQHLQPFISELELRLTLFSRSLIPHIYIQSAMSANMLIQLLRELKSLMSSEQWQEFERAIRIHSSSMV